jgi:hypothetical protein
MCCGARGFDRVVWECAGNGWIHEISRERAEEQVWAGKVLEQARRISVTLRRLCPEENVHYMES